MALALGAEAAARRHRDLGVVHQAARELHRAHGAEALGQRRPHEHAGARRVEVGPADAPQPVHQGVAPLLVLGGLFVREPVALAQRDDRGDLDGLEDAVVVVPLDLAQRPDDRRVAGAVADAPSRHVERLRHGGELDPDLHRAGGGEEARGPVVVEADLPVGEVVHDDELVPARDGHDLLEELRRHAVRGGVVRIVEEEDLGARRELAGYLADPLQEHLVVGDRDPEVAASGEHHGVGVDGERRGGHQRGVARPEQGEAEVAEALLRADGGDDLLVRVEADAPVLVVVLRHLAAQVVEPGRGRVAVVPRVVDHLAELVDDGLRRGVGGIAHRHVDDVDAAAPLAREQRVDAAEHVGRQPRHALAEIDEAAFVVGHGAAAESAGAVTAGRRSRREAGPCSPTP